LQLAALNARGKKLWSAPLPEANWEPSLVAGSNRTGGQTIFYNDSRLTTALDAENGSALWRFDVKGECQRQIASIDWNGDGSQTWRPRQERWSRYSTARRAHRCWRSSRKRLRRIRLASERPGVPTIATYAVGGLTLIGAGNRVTLETQLDDRKLNRFRRCRKEPRRH